MQESVNKNVASSIRKNLNGMERLLCSFQLIVIILKRANAVVSCTLSQCTLLAINSTAWKNVLEVGYMCSFTF